MTMSDFENRLRDAMAAAVAGAEPPAAILELVRHRHRRRLVRSAAAAAVIAAVAVGAAQLAGVLPTGRGPGSHRAGSARLFPGGGRLLLVRNGILRWLYPDGRSAEIGAGFAGASLTGSELLAWRNASPPGASRYLRGCLPGCSYDVSYYELSLDGFVRRLVLAAEPPVHGHGIYHLNVLLSPDGSRLAYIRQVDKSPTSGVTLSSTLWSIDLGTGRRTDLGPYSGSFTWRDSATVVVESPGGKALQLLSVADRRRTTYLTVTEPRLVHAYERARPGAGPPASISPDGWSAGPGGPVLAVGLSGAGHAWRGGIRYPAPAEALVGRGRVVALAPNAMPIVQLTWGTRGSFLLATGEGDDPGSWLNGTYAANVHGGRLVHQQTFGEPWDSAVFNPAGNVIAFYYASGGPVAFVPLARPACQQSAGCLSFRPKPLFGLGTLLDWAPDPAR